MQNIILPNTNRNGDDPNEFSDVYENDARLKERLEELAVEVIELEGRSLLGRWYTPKVIATEESRTGTSFGTFTTPDEIKSVAVPANSVVLIYYSALLKSSVTTGSIALFIGANQLKRPGGLSGEAPEVQETGTGGTANKWRTLTSTSRGLVTAAGETSSFVTTGMIMSGTLSEEDAAPISVHRLAANTYDFSVKTKSPTGTMTAKERLLQVAVLG